jgi:hypothetical protein
VNACIDAAGPGARLIEEAGYLPVIGALGGGWRLDAKLVHQIFIRERIIFHDPAIGETVVGQASGRDLLPGALVGHLQGETSYHRSVPWRS